MPNSGVGSSDGETGPSDGSERPNGPQQLHPASGRPPSDDRQRTVPISARALNEAVALAHNVGGVELAIVTKRRELRVGRDVSCDLSPCELRRAVLLNAETTGTVVPPGVRGVRVGGSLHDRGGGLYELGSVDGSAERWFTTELCATDVVAIAERCGTDGVDDVECRVGSDLQLGITTVRLRSTVGTGPHLDDAARWVLDQCVVEELVQRVRAAAVTPGA